jgi:hypothetical protein
MQGLQFKAEPKKTAASLAAACVTDRQAYRRAYAYMATIQSGHVIVHMINVMCCGIRFRSGASITSTVHGTNSLVQKSLLGVAVVTSEGGGNSFVIKSALL